MTVTNQPSAKAGKGSSRSPAARLPSARERRPALAALAVLLIAGGAVLAGWLALRQSHTSEYVEVAAPLSKGQQLSLGSYQPVELPTDSGSYIKYSDLDSLGDEYALVDMVPGQPLVEAMVGAQPVTAQGEVHLGMNLIPDQYPPTLQEGDLVTINLLDGSDDGTPARTTSGVVNQIDGSDTGDGAWVDVTISADCQADFASASVAGDVALVIAAPSDPTYTCDEIDKP